ncbi:MAG: ATP-binding protein [Chloroflexota bacterium]
MKFCGNCGTRLVDAAPGSSSPDAAPFGAQFGTMIGADLADRLRRAGVEASGQRRNVTVLFADISGFTALSQRIDSEDLYNMIQRYVRVLSANVYKYDGVVDKIAGDGLMALYGAPISHENNAERAIRSAMDMQVDLQELNKELRKEIDFDLSVRIGLHSGSVIVGGIGSDLMMNYTAIGDTVNLASRLESSGVPGGILISEAVYRQVRKFVDCEQQAPLQLKGIAQPVVAYRVIGLKSRPGSARGIEGLHAPMIGRDAELNRLRLAVDDLLEHRHGQFALITGEAGLGKSRLTAEFKAALDRDQVRVLEGQSLAYRRVSYWLIRELLLCYLELPSTAPLLEVRERLAQQLDLRLGEDARETLPLLEHLMGLPYSDPEAGERLKRMDPAQLRQLIFLAMRDLLAVELQYCPLVLVLDDLHWADDASLELVRFLLDALRLSPLFVLAISRVLLPGPLEQAVKWARLNLGERYHEINLVNLSRDQSQLLLDLLLSIPELPDKLRDQILQRAAGIPFYLEEILRMLIDQGVLHNQDGQWQVVPGADPAALGVPDTLQELILARFDRLQPGLRRTLQMASVIGRTFSLPLLSAVLPLQDARDLYAVLEELEKREFVQAKAASRTEYNFRHILMSDAIYGTILRKERSAMHGQVAETIERMYADRLDEQVELLANHYRWSPYPDRALHYLVLSGQRSAGNQAYLQASQQLEAALELSQRVQPSPSQMHQIYSGLGDAQLFFGEYPRAREYYEQALRQLRLEADGCALNQVSSLHRRIARTHERQGEYEMAMANLTLGRDLLQQASERFPDEQAQVLNDLGWLHYRRGNMAEAEALLQGSLVLVEGSDAYDVIASIYNRLGGIAFNKGDGENAAVYIRKSIAIREATRDLVNLAASFNNFGLLEIEMGQLDDAYGHLARCLELKTRLGQPEGIAIALNNLGWLNVQRGELDAAHQDLEKASELSRQIGYSSLQSGILKNLAVLALMRRDWRQAQALTEQYLATIDGDSAPESLADCYCMLGQAAFGAGEIEQARRWAAQAGALLDDSGFLADNPDAFERGDYLRLLGMLAAQSGDWTAAEEHFNESQALFARHHSLLNEARAGYQLGCLAQQRGDLDRAAEIFSRLETTFKRIGARLDQQWAEEALHAVTEARV